LAKFFWSAKFVQARSKTCPCTAGDPQGVIGAVAIDDDDLRNGAGQTLERAVEPPFFRVRDDDRGDIHGGIIAQPKTMARSARRPTLDKNQGCGYSSNQ